MLLLKVLLLSVKAAEPDVAQIPYVSLFDTVLLVMVSLDPGLLPNM